MKMRKGALWADCLPIPEFMKVYAEKHKNNKLVKDKAPKRSTVFSWVKSGKVEAEKKGNEWFIHRDSLEFISGGKGSNQKKKGPGVRAGVPDHIEYALNDKGIAWIKIAKNTDKRWPKGWYYTLPGSGKVVMLGATKAEALTKIKSL